MLKKRIAVIPARGGSKRIPRKNIIDFDGKPMIAWTIASAIDSKLFDRVIVSTDDMEIAEISKNYGAEVPFLRECAIDDFSPVSDATLEAIRQAENYWLESYDEVVQLMPNCPLRGAAQIKEAYEFFDTHEYPFLISAIDYGWFNPWWAHRKSENGQFKPIFEDSIRARSQDLPELLCPTGIIWIADCSALLKQRSFYGDNYALYPFEWQYSADIDNYADLERTLVIKKIYGC